MCLGLLRFRQRRVQSAKSDEQATFVYFLAILADGATIGRHSNAFEHCGLQSFSKRAFRLGIH